VKSLDHNALVSSGVSPAEGVAPDFVCENHGSIFLLRPHSPAAFLWIHENLPADRQMWGTAVVISHSCIWAILGGIQEAGMVVARG
jgi:hypothetical protein